jgi:hypothetical protein
MLLSQSGTSDGSSAGLVTGKAFWSAFKLRNQSGRSDPSSKSGVKAEVLSGAWQNWQFSASGGFGFPQTGQRMSVMA